MNYISVKEASQKLNLSERSIQKYCELNRIPDCTRVSGVWLIPENVQKPTDERLSVLPADKDVMTLNELCDLLSISIATGRNWIKLKKIVPEYTGSGTPYFKREYVNSISNALKSGENEALKSRRNKKFVSGNSLYNSYVSEKCQNLFLVQKLLDEIKVQNINITEEIILYFLADCSLHFIASKDRGLFSGDRKFLFNNYLSGKLSFKEKELIDALIKNKKQALNFAKEYPSLFSFDYTYEEKEDVLGLIYISCKNIGNRKATGSYYTPTRIVNNLITSLELNNNTTILDPCCGTGNFLLQLPDNIPFKNIYGIDIDSTSVKITRINMALHYPEIPINVISEHITEGDYLFDSDIPEVSMIIGNPPWGYSFSEVQKKNLKQKYKATTNTNIESYDIFLEKSLDILKENGKVSFVLPEALLNVKAHSDIRKIILAKANIKKLKYLGNAFDGVQCPCIIINLEKNLKEHTTKGMLVDDGTREFRINTKRDLNSEYFSFLTNDEEYKILKKIRNFKNCTNLSGKADFALGIVTGNNKEIISSEKNKKNEIVLKGLDICKFRIKPSRNFIIFDPEKFQQVADEKMYRAKEKLLYRFISNQLVFAYDDKQTLSLNSCNIVIPRIPDIKIKYVLSILNSRVAQFIYKKEFNSIKVLRSHIESFPIPLVDSSTQDLIIKITDKLIAGLDSEKAERTYDELDNLICGLFRLDTKDVEVIKNAVEGENKFLI